MTRIASNVFRLKTILSLPEFTDNCLINFLVVGDTVFAITESNYIRKINADTLETEEKVGDVIKTSRSEMTFLRISSRTI